MRRIERLRPAAQREIPEDLARALDESAADLKHGRILSLDDMLREMQAEFDTHFGRDRGKRD